MFEEATICSVVAVGLTSMLVEVLVPIISSVLYDGGPEVEGAVTENVM